MNDDALLLRRYVEEGSETAFTELVHRHVDLVYNAALRRTGGDTHRSADVAQHVFTMLARKAQRLSRHTILPAWLHTATRNAALNLMISEQRRQSRENAAMALNAVTTESNAHHDWENIRPLLDAAIDGLPATDRAAVVLRFLERRPFAAIGAALNVSEDAARMRTERALEKLRRALSRRGITSTAAALGSLVTAHPAFSAPAGLATALAAKSLATVAATTGFFTTFATLMTTPTLASIAFSAAVAFGAGAYFGFSRNLDAAPPPPLPTPQHSETIAALRRDNQSLKNEIGRLTADVTRLSAARVEAPRAAASPVENEAAVVRRSSVQRAVLNNLRQLSAAIDQFQLENKRPPTSLDELVGDTKYIRRLVSVDGENYATITLQPNRLLLVTTSTGLTISFDPSGNNTTVPETTAAMQRAKELADRITPATKKAVEAYRSAHNNQQPPTPEAIIPYFATPQEGADFVEALDAQKAAAGK